MKWYYRFIWMLGITLLFLLLIVLHWFMYKLVTYVLVIVWLISMFMAI